MAYYAGIEKVRELITQLEDQHRMNPVVFKHNPVAVAALRTLLDGFIRASTIVDVERALTPDQEN